MRHFPVFLELTGRRVLVLGDGEVADRKADPLRRAGAEIVMAHAFTPELLDDCAFAVGADAAEPELLALSQAARARGVPVNVVDRPALSTAIMPAIVDRDPITIAISTSGTAPVLARLLRNRVEAIIPPAFGRLAVLAESLTAEIRSRLPDLAQRRAALDRAFTGAAAERVFAGDEAAARAAFLAEIEAGEGARAGMVFLVGAGPGAADLLTLRAHRLLGQADIIVHDRLVTAEVLDMARRDAERIYVGKRRADHCMSQEDINALLVRLGREGHVVVRLKGGDPFVFGRGGEEAEALAAAGVAFEVVPGVTAALACAAQAKIPLTHRAHARSVTFLTGHTRDGRLDIHFPDVAHAGCTLAVYMGLVTLPELVAGLIEHGRDPSTPAALVERGGTARQRVLRASLAELPGLAPAWASGGPVMTIVGEVVGSTASLEGALAELAA